MFSTFVPHYRVVGIAQLSPEWLRQRAIDSLLLDVDCTLKRYRTEEIGPREAHWLADVRAAGVGVCLVSNGRGPRIGRLAKRYELPFVAMAMKPLPFGCRRAVKQMGFDRRRTAIVGDQLFTDIVAGRMAGVRTILVDPIHPEDEPWMTRVKRPLEAWLVGRRRPSLDCDVS